VSKRWMFPVVAALFVATFSACGASDTKDAATVTSCVPGTDGAKPHAVGEVRNTSSKTSSFFVRIEFHDSSGNRVSEGVDTINDVEPGTASPFNITGLADAKGPVTCEVGTVRRTAAPGS
jgi:hypothetical protein